MSKESEKFRFEVKNQSDSASEILIYGYIGKYEDVDYKGFRNSFQKILTSYKDVTVRIHSGGGSVYEGLAIYDLMRSSDSNITVIVEGMAASMGSIIALGGDVIQMTQNAFFMMHAPSSGCYGDKTAMQSTASQLDQAENRLVEIYKERTQAEESVILDWMKPNNDTWVDSDQCLKMKICDEIITPSKNRVFQASPADMKNKSAEEIFAAYEGEIPNEIKNQINEKMKNRIISMLAAASIVHTLTASSEDEDFEKALKDVFAKANRCETAEAGLKNFQKTNAQILIDKAAEEGKFPPSEKDQWLKDAIENPELTARALSRMTGKPDINGGVNRDAQNIETGKHELLKGREAWTFDKWQTEDPKGLSKMEDEAPEDFKKLFNAKFN
ncbi:head maturation protease, ClpP-related [Flavobacterium maritimum]|uniref:head maturation protease, ClpP-related n=1 Tax=Flavobacterium maritimum TaxID=3149042 RepID=UPI0032B45020